MVRSAAMLPQSALKAAVGASAAIFLIFLVTVGNVDRGEPAGVLLEERYLYGAHGKRGRSPAPGVKAMEERFETFYQKGLRGGEETRIDLPVQHFSVTSSGVHAAGVGSLGGDAKTIQLTRAERSTAEEERKDPGALLRLRAIGGHVSHKIERIMGSLEHKLDQASGEHSHAATGPAKPRVAPSDDAWDKAFEGKLAKLDATIRTHGTNRPQYRPRSWIDNNPTDHEQVEYQNALRSVLGANPKALPGVY